MFRPAIDPLFRSAALAFGPRVTGVILSGTLDDGTAGLWAVKQRGGIAAVQHPQDASFPGMPLNALRYVAADYCLTAAELGPLLDRLGRESRPPIGESPVSEELVRTGNAHRR
jgi:two-component system chemotaxis response regulator CheB